MIHLSSQSSLGLYVDQKYRTIVKQVVCNPYPLPAVARTISVQWRLHSAFALIKSVQLVLLKKLN